MTIDELATIGAATNVPDSVQTDVRAGVTAILGVYDAMTSGDTSGIVAGMEHASNCLWRAGVAMATIDRDWARAAFSVSADIDAVLASL